jgi:hypothetical protein
MNCPFHAIIKGGLHHVTCTVNVGGVDIFWLVQGQGCGTVDHDVNVFHGPLHGIGIPNVCADVRDQVLTVSVIKGDKID